MYSYNKFDVRTIALQWSLLFVAILAKDHLIKFLFYLRCVRISVCLFYSNTIACGSGGGKRSKMKRTAIPTPLLKNFPKTDFSPCDRSNKCKRAAASRSVLWAILDAEGWVFIRTYMRDFYMYAGTHMDDICAHLKTNFKTSGILFAYMHRCMYMESINPWKNIRTLGRCCKHVSLLLLRLFEGVWCRCVCVCDLWEHCFYAVW